MLAALAAGSISLSVAGRLAPHLTEENIEKVLQDCAGMTKRAVEEYVVRFKAKPVFEPSIRKLPSRTTALDAPSPGGRKKEEEVTETTPGEGGGEKDRE